MKKNIIPSRAHAFSHTAVLARIFSTGIVAIGASLLSMLAAAERPVNSSTSWMTDNTRVALDMAARQIHPAGGSDQNIFFVGLDYHRVVIIETGPLLFSSQPLQNSTISQSHHPIFQTAMVRTSSGGTLILTILDYLRVLSI
jgi:hypothetical protein